MCQRKFETFDKSTANTVNCADTTRLHLRRVMCPHKFETFDLLKVNSLRALKQMTSQAQVKRTVSLLFCALMRLICLRLVGADTIVYPWVTLISPKGS